MDKDQSIRIIIESMPSSSWTEALSALLVPVIAVVGLLIAYQQYRINKQRLKHELYKRRLRLFKKLKAHLVELVAKRKILFYDALDFGSIMSESAFLFNDEINNKIEEIRRNSLDMALLYKEIYPISDSKDIPDESKGISDEEKRKDLESEHEILVEWHYKQYKNLNELFKEHLSLKS